ncbi:thioredoxin domain-containing protein [Halobacteriales archaeon QS_8_69_26]|nr:MAG: thioredoxin domain-containing protein [Halobacteriales archaeon QS_8_69_26]
MSDAPTDRNRLDAEESPYLRQHADNPVNWQPWDEAALAAARERDVPVFLSVGYSACHWCHVMEEESFEDPEVAEVLNEQFVPVKVDREERPDLDSVYQTICQQVSGRGGWPLSAWLTPEGKPFYVGTYFPTEPRRGMPGFGDLLERIADSWSDPEDRREMERRAEQWTDAVRGELEETPDPGDPPGEALLGAADALVRGADREHGGFTASGPKFPHPGRIHLLLRAFDRTGRDAYRDVATGTLDAMAAGGMYDHLGGGFHRYATDRTWTVPHFEKMLYDNAEIPRAYLAAYRLTGWERYAGVVRETFAFVERELTHPDGGFYSTLDARSRPPESRIDGDDGDGRGEGDEDPTPEEGAFYAWTSEEVDAAIDDDTDAALFEERYGVTPAGNFEGTTVLTETATVPELSKSFDTSESEVEERLDRARAEALAAREERPRPRRDEKVLAGWNGLMIAALAEGATVLDDDYLAPAEDALAFVREHLWDPDEERLSRRYKDGDVKGVGYLEDYAFLGRGALACYGATGDPDHLGFALDLARAVVEEFYDPGAGTLYFTPESGEDLVTRPQELRDQSTPSSVGVAVELLLALDPFLPAGNGDGSEGGDEGAGADPDGWPDFAGVAESVLGTHGSRVESRPTEHATLALAADDWAVGHLEVTVAADGVPAAWRDRLAERYLPALVLAPRPPTGDGLRDWLDRLGLDDPGPIWAGREARDGDGDPTLYVCRSFTCSPPQTGIDEALEWADRLAPEAGSGER